MAVVNEQVLGALLNHRLSHTAFRVYVMLTVELDSRDPENPATFSVPKLRAAIPGVQGKRLGLTALGVALGELADLDLIDVYGPVRSTKSVIIGSPEKPRGRGIPPARVNLLLDEEDS